MTIIWITEAERQRAAQARRERIEQDGLWMALAGWLLARAGHDGPVTLPRLTAETEARLIRLLRGEQV